MKIRGLTQYRDRTGKVRIIKLYRHWKGILARTAGTAHDGYGNYRWAGLEVGFSGWPHFREWALMSGFLKYGKSASLDRIDESKGYTPDNCQWLTKAENTRKARKKIKPARGGLLSWCTRAGYLSVAGPFLFSTAGVIMYEYGSPLAAI